MRFILMPLAVLFVALPARSAEPCTPAAPEQIPTYSVSALPCKSALNEGTSYFECKGDLLQKKTLRELSIMRNSIFARYGWDGYRKDWLREYFHTQSWFKPNPKFHYSLLSAVDRTNVHLIATYEQSLSSAALTNRRDEVYMRAGKSWNDKPEWTIDGKQMRGCKPPKDLPEEEQERAAEALDRSKDCEAERFPWYKPDPHYSDDKLSADARIELGLISRALGGFAVDDDRLGAVASSLDAVLDVQQLRHLSLRDLRLLRNTIFARHGRKFVSKVLQQHFDSMRWYTADPAYTDARLTATDGRNIKLIKSVEGEFGGALSDEDWLIDPAVDIA